MSTEKLNLNDIMTLEYGGNLTEDERNDGDVPVYGSNGRIGWHNEPLVEEPSIMVARKGSIGSVHYEENPSYPIDVTYYIPESSIPDNINHKYLYYYLDSVKWERFKTGTSIPSLSRGMIQGLEIPVPSVDEQERVVSLLSDVDEYIEKTSERVHALEQSKQAVLQRVFDGLDIRDCSSDISDGVYIEDHFNIVSGATPSTETEKYWGGDINWISPKEIESKYINETERTLTDDGLDACSAKMLPVGSVLMTSRAGIGNCAVNKIPLCTNQGFKSFIPKDDGDILSEFLMYWLIYNKPEIERFASGSTFTEVNKTIVKRFKVPLMSQDKQEEIVEIMSDIDECINETSSDLESVRELKKGLLQNIFSN